MEEEVDLLVEGTTELNQSLRRSPSRILLILEGATTNPGSKKTRGMINLKFNVIIVRSLGILLTNVGRSRKMLESSLHISKMSLRMIKTLCS
jgi:hypothetical protein